MKNSTKKTVSIHIGEYYISYEPTVIYTLLGSCVAVCLFDEVLGIGGMNHILLPGIAMVPNDELSSRYALNAMEMLKNRLICMGAPKNRLVAKLFGGSQMFTTVSDKMKVGRLLSQFVLNYLDKEGIKIASQDLGGNYIRKIFFHTDSGDVYLKRVLPGENAALVDKAKRQIKLAYEYIRKTGQPYPVLKKRF